jgi:PKD repeat protein
MKKQLLIFLLSLLTVPMFAQNCGFTIANNASGAVTMVPASTFPGIYQWTFGDNTSGTSFGPIVHTYNSFGAFNVCMSVMDSMGNIFCSYCDSILVQPTISCNFTVYQSPGSLIVDFLAYPPVGAFASWTYGDGTAGTGSNPYHIYSTTGNYTVCLNLVDSATGNILCTSCQQVSLTPVTNNCTLTAFPDSMNANLYYFFGAPAYSTSTVVWNYGDGSTGTGNSTQHFYSTPGVYTACMNEVNPNGVLLCTSCYQVVISPTNPQCNFTYTADPNLPGLFWFASNYNGPAAQIVWDFGNGTTGTGTFDSVFFAAPVNYTVCMSAVDANGTVLCNSCQLVTMPPPPPACAAYFVANSVALTASYIDLSTGATPATSYSWSFGDGTGSSLRFPQHTYAMPGVYQTCLTISDTMCQDQYCSTVLVDTTNSPAGPCNAQFVTLQIAPFDVVVIDLSSGTNLSYFWDFGDGTTSNQQYPSHYYSTIGSYVLCLTVNNGLLGCSSTYCDTLTVDSMGNVYRTLTGFNLNVTSASAFTGIGSAPESTSFRIYPNPAADFVVIDQASAITGNTTYRIFNLQGGVVSTGNIKSAGSRISIRDLSSGTYVLDLLDASGHHSFAKLIKN